MLAVLLVALPTGMLIGAVGVGGVLLPPAMLHLGGLDVHAAAGTAIWSFLFTGVIGSYAYARRGSVPWRFTGWLAAGVLPAALAGALVNGLLNAVLLSVLLGVVTLGTGVYNLLARRGSGGRPGLSAPAAFGVGAMVGFGSALTGTGGPVLAVPTLLALGVAPLPTVAASVVIQLPLVVTATVGYASHGHVQFGLGTAVGVIAGVGVLLGARFALAVREEILRRIVASALVLVGVFLLLNQM